MGAVICTSEKAAAPLNERPNSKHSGKSLRRKITKDSIYDSSDFIECSSLIHSSGKERVKRTIISDGQTDNSAQPEMMEFTTSASDATKNESPTRSKVEFSKYSSSQSFFKHVWSRKHKTYTSVSTQCIRRISCDSQCFTKDQSSNEIETTSIPILKESVGQQTDSEMLDKEACTRPPSTCFEHLTSFLSFDGKCGLCDFVHSGEHHRWDSLEDDATAFKEVSKSIGKWLHSTPKFMDKIILQKTESCQKVRIILRKDKNGVQEILVTDGSTSYQIQVANPPDNGENNEEGASAAANDGDQTANQEGASSTNGSGAVVIRRMNPRGGQLLRSKAQESDSLDQTESRLPPVDTMEACNKAAERLRELANHLQHGEVPISVLQKALQYAACVLDTVCVDDSR